MKTKSQIIKDLKLAYPVIKDGNDTDGYVELSDVEYDARIEVWANNELEELTEQAEAEAKATAKAAAEGKLAALGLTTDDLRALGL
jgi:hypothetical protein